MLIDSPAAERNKEPILAVLREVLPPTGLVLEIASGSGQHVLHFAQALTALEWQPTDADPACCAAIASRLAATPLANVLPPLRLEVERSPWPVTSPVDAIVCINLLHISPWTVTGALMHHARRVLAAGRPLYLYGPYKEGGRHTAPSNESFDSGLRLRNPLWGVRDLEEVVAVARQHGFRHATTLQMPANNLSVVLM